MSAHDVITDFISFMETEGVKPIEPIANRLTSEKIVRFRCEGDKPGRSNGWAILYLDDRPAGRFGNFRLGVDRTWSFAGDNRQLSPEEKAALRREWAEAKAKRQEERERSEREAALDARDLWSRAVPASETHPYVMKKRLDPLPLRELDGKLLVPMYDANGKLWNLQRIAGDGSKRFLRGGRTEGLFCLVGYDTRDPRTYCIGEGYATMAAVHRSSGHPCIVAFSASNLMAVGRIWNAARPDLNFIVCGDDDTHLPRNIGREAAEALAAEIGAEVTFPVAPAAEAA